MIRPSRRALSPAAGVSLYSKLPLPRNQRPPAHRFAAFLVCRKTSGYSSNARANFQFRRVPSGAMDCFREGSFDFIKSHTTKSPASDAGSVDSFDSSVFDEADDLTSLLLPDFEGQDSSTSESKPPSEKGAAKAEEQTEAPYTPRFAIPSPPPPIDGIRSDPPEYFTHKLYRDPEGKPVTVHYCTNFEKAEELCKPFLNEKVVGFDMEWESYARPEAGIKKNISVIQVCSESTAVVFHIAQFKRGNTTKELIPPLLISLLESRDVIKTGVAVWTADGKRIEKFLGLNPRGFIELSHFFHVLQNRRLATGAYPKALCALATQIKTYIGFPLPKVGKIRCSNWSRNLNLAQIDYAAADAYAGLALYHVMNEKRKQMRPTPPHPRFAELGLPIEGAKEENVQPSQAAEKSPDDPKLPISQVKKARRQDDAITISKEAGEASKNLLDFLTPSEPCLQNWKIAITGRLTCLSRPQVYEFIARCGGEALQGSRMTRSATMVVLGSHVNPEKLLSLHENGLPTIYETEFYNMIRNRHLVKYSLAGPQNSKRRQYLENLLTELFQSVCADTFRAPVPLGDTISSVCRETPKTVMELQKIDGALFLYTVLKGYDHDLLKILHETSLPPGSMLEGEPDTKTALVKDL